MVLRCTKCVLASGPLHVLLFALNEGLNIIEIDTEPEMTLALSGNCAGQPLYQWKAEAGGGG
jgi:hypothetical protein